jgi:uroporphyrinogen-III decarboxylase
METTRELFLEVMNFNKSLRTLKWNFGYWGSTIKNWYRDGLPEEKYPKISTETINISYSLYTSAWTHKWKTLGSKKNVKIELPDGIGVWGGANCQPNQGIPLDHDVKKYFGLDQSGVLANVEQLFYPKFDVSIISEDENSLTYIDLDGVKRKFMKNEATVPTFIDSPIKDSNSWNIIKNERLKLEEISKRFPSDWNELVKEYNNRDYPLYIGGYPIGLFGILVHLLGYENLFLFFYDKPNIIKDMLETFTNVWMAVWEELLSKVEIDAIHFWEDISMGKGSMVSPAIIKEFLVPYYKKIISFLKGKGVKAIMLDTDGNCEELIPIFLDCGVNCIYPMEVNAGMNILEIRKKYPEMIIMGGISKSEIAFGENHIDKMLEPVGELLKYGGYIPCCDHWVPPEIPWKYFKYYMEKLNYLIDNKAKKQNYYTI